jgi:hypothetical protein
MMTQGEANTISVGDTVKSMGNEICKVVDLEFVFDSNENQVIMATLETDTRTFKTNLLMCQK